MSDSEEDFQSADEGEEEKTSHITSDTSGGKESDETLAEPEPEAAVKESDHVEETKDEPRDSPSPNEKVENIDEAKSAEKVPGVSNSEVSCDTEVKTLPGKGKKKKGKQEKNQQQNKQKAEMQSEDAKEEEVCEDPSTGIVEEKPEEYSDKTAEKTSGKASEKTCENTSDNLVSQDDEQQTTTVTENQSEPNESISEKSDLPDKPSEACDKDSKLADEQAPLEEADTASKSDKTEKTVEENKCEKEDNVKADTDITPDISSEPSQAQSNTKTQAKIEDKPETKAKPDTVEAKIEDKPKIVETTSAAKSDTVAAKTPEKEVHSLFDKLAGGGASKPQRDEKEENVLDKLSKAGDKKQEGAGWGSWGSWGTSLLSTATTSVKTFTHSVSDGMHTVVETFEASVGAPPADQLASDISEHVKEPEEKEKAITEEPTDEPHIPNKESEASGGDVGEIGGDKAQGDTKQGSDWLHDWGVDSLTSQLQSTGKGLLDSGLDVLETIGKKTFEQIKETDPGFAKTRGFLAGNKPNLSQMLREAKEETDKRAAEELSSQPLESYSSLFDKHQGMAHLEALEMLSISCTNFMSNTDDVSDDSQDKIDALAEKFTQVYDSDDDADEEHDFPAGMEDFVSKLSLPVKSTKLINVQNKTREWLKSCQERQDTGEQIEGREIHSEALNSFAELTSYTMELCHKSGELLLLSPEQERQVDVDAVSDAMISILRLVNSEITAQSHLYNECLNTAADDSEDPDSINPMITDVFLEASNSTSYTRDAFKLLIPVLNKCVVMSPSGESDSLR